MLSDSTSTSDVSKSAKTETSATPTSSTISTANSTEKVACRPRDDDHCLQTSPEWDDSYKCATSIQYCISYEKDMRRCCPESCNTGIFTEQDCNDSWGSGTCIYPNNAQCSLLSTSTISSSSEKMESTQYITEQATTNGPKSTNLYALVTTYPSNHSYLTTKTSTKTSTVTITCNTTSNPTTTMTMNPTTLITTKSSAAISSQTTTPVNTTQRKTRETSTPKTLVTGKLIRKHLNRMLKYYEFIFLLIEQLE